MKFSGEISRDVALKLAAVLDDENKGVVNSNPGLEFRCTRCDGVLSYHRGDVTSHFEHQRGYATGGIGKHKPL